MKTTFADSHSHLSDLRLESEISLAIGRAKQRGVQFFLQGGVGPEDWERQKLLKQKFPQEIGLCFGIHPYWVADHNPAECESALDQLARALPEAMAIGELGLDLRPHIMKDSLNRQIEIFEAQIELAEMAKKPMVLHLVQAFDEAIQIFETWGVPSKSGMVHSFNGSLPQAEKYLELGLYLSVGGPVARPDNLKLHQAVQGIPWDRLLLETDSPDQPPPRLKGQLNEPESLWDVAEMIGKLRGKDPAEILDISSQNLRKLLSQ